MNRAATAVTITDPFVKYTSLIATGVFSPDAAQYRLAYHLQKVYLRLKDYTPSHEYQSRLRQIAKAVDNETQNNTSKAELASLTHPIRRNPLFARFFLRRDHLGGRNRRDSLTLARTLTSHQAAVHVDSPRGLFLSGEVGTGKSMLLDLLAEGLPTRRKRRWHFNTFMLHALSRLEEFRRSRPHVVGGDGPEYSLLWMAKELVETSPILFLDEFQLPDRAASKIMSNLLVSFFQLGGVLVASSNRMPEELEKATGGRYSPPATGGLVERVLLGLGKGQSGGELFGQTSDFAPFLEVLKARCDFWHMEGTQDWRRRESRTAQLTNSAVLAVPEVFSQAEESASLTADTVSATQMPAMYFSLSEAEDMWVAALRDAAIPVHANNPEWESCTLIVYGRRLTVPRQRDGTSYWDFIIDRVPVLNISAKNEARRFISLLDALYESRCKLIIRAEAGPDELFFPETRGRSIEADKEQTTNAQIDEDSDATYSETIAEVYQDQVSPFRPNISTYSESPNAKYDPDQDSDFGKEQDRQTIDFGKAGAFTGEDERFAYKRATSRLWELCSAQWHTRTGDWWQPLPKDARHWEGPEPSRPPPSPLSTRISSEIEMGRSVELEEPAGLERLRIARLKGKSN